MLVNRKDTARMKNETVLNSSDKLIWISFLEMKRWCYHIKDFIANFHKSMRKDVYKCHRHNFQKIQDKEFENVKYKKYILQNSLYVIKTIGQ